MSNVETEKSQSNNNLDLHAEARNAVLEEMTKNGLMEKMRAQLKSEILKSLEKQKKNLKQNIEFDYMTPLHKLSKSREVILSFFLIKEFLQFFEMEYTLPIFENEFNFRENVKRETLLSDFFLKDKEKEGDSKPVLIHLIQNYFQEMSNKKNSYAQKLDDSYGVKNHIYNPDIHITNEEEVKKNSLTSTSSLLSNPLSILNMGSSGSKKGQLAPISFTNKSVDLKESDSETKNHESSKFNTSNYSDIYSEVKTNSVESKVTTSFDKKFGFDQKGINEEKKEEKNLSSKINTYSFQSESETNKDKEFDDQFNEVILEEIENENKNKINISNLEDFEDSKKSITNSNSHALSLGYDNSVTNYKMDEFDHIEEVEAPK